MKAEETFLVAIACLIALSVGIFSVYVDQHNSEPQAAALVLLMGTGLLGLAFPHRAWRWALLAGLCIPLFGLLATMMHLPGAGVPEPGWYGGLIALIPAFIGAYCGWAARQAFGPVERT